MTGDDWRPALASLGPYFSLDPAPADPAAAGWRPFEDLLQPGPLEERTAYTRASLAGLAGGEVEERVAASTVSLGLFSRLLSPVVGAAALGVAAPPLALDTVWWRPFETGPWPLAVERAGQPGGLDEALSFLVDRFATGFGLSRMILWGNVSSALFGAVAGLRASRPDLVPAATAFALATLGRPPYAGTGDVVRGTFVRRSCCLYYRVPGGGYCGDCVLTR
ncbi:(2Fe-2S)-binding protein [Mumia sp. zg.B17]|uniref:(2Fe-2S)-binding protein n=1 Tax=Mumia sp. zg.B17 TaxID=2855446 RepID=UPI001C6F1A18|nr:(2Fe-2S)-binding protein [Mumia sp. zg.B17]MBW9204448.1 (2Fe-2S)-binding protein [Mumia sp. zg.B17]